MLPKEMFYRIKQIRSTIGLPPRARKNLVTLGLRKRHAVVYQRVSVATAHKLRLVKELVEINLLEGSEVAAAKAKDNEGFPSGFEKVGQL